MPNLRLEQLDQHLQNNLAPIYIIAGDEILLVQEACETIRTAALKKEWVERRIFQVETGFDWESFIETCYTFSLFNEKECLELRLHGSLGEAGTRALKQYSEKPPSDKLLLIVSPRLDQAAQKTTWFQAVTKTGIFIPVWPLEKATFPTWISNRLKKLNLETDQASIVWLADAFEGNLLACANALSFLKIQYGVEKFTLEQLKQALSQQAHFDIFALSEAVLSGNLRQTEKVFKILKEEGVEPTLILWCLARDIRALNRIEKEKNPRRVNLLKAALKRHSPQSLIRFLSRAQECDKILKRQSGTLGWVTLERLGYALAKGIK